MVISREARNLCHPRRGTHAFPTCAAYFSAFLICLSYRPCPIRPFGAPSPRGEGCDAREACQQETFGHRHYLYSAALLYSDAPHRHFAFLISNFSFKQSFHSQSRGSTPHRLALNLEPFPSIQNPARVTPTGSFPIILLPFSRCGVPYTPRVWHRGSRDVRSISSSQKR